MDIVPILVVGGLMLVSTLVGAGIAQMGHDKKKDQE